MRIGLVWPLTYPLVDITVRYERFVRGFEALDHQVVTVCPEPAAVGYGFPVHTVPGPAALRDSGLWRKLGLDAVVIITWLRMPEIVAAIKSACPHVVSVGDSDGIVGARVYPLTILRRMVAFHTQLGMKSRAAKHWVQLVLGGYRAAERPLIESADEVDLITVNSKGALANLAGVFAYHQRPDLTRKVVVISYPVDEEFLSGGVPTAAERADRVVAVGRWDDPQKDAQLLAAGIKEAAVLRPDTEFVLIGRDGNGTFARLCQRVARLKYLGVLPPTEIARFLRDSRALVLSSRWESGPIVAAEALCAGCSLVGPSWVPTVPWYCDEGPYGTVFAQRSARALAGALTAELGEWDFGHRDPLATAAHFRPWFTPATVCREMLTAATRESDDHMVGTDRHWEC